MSTLDINTNGSWRTVISDLRPAQEDAVKAACLVISTAGSKPGVPASVAKGPSWRLRDAEGKVFLYAWLRPGFGYEWRAA